MVVINKKAEQAKLLILRVINLESQINNKMANEVINTPISKRASIKKCWRAFTLIELLVTIIIMSLVMTIVVVQIKEEPAMLTVSNSAKKLKGMMLRASTQAVALNIPVSIGYHKQKHMFVIVYDFNSLVQLPKAKKLEKNSNDDEDDEDNNSSEEEELTPEERMQKIIARAANYTGNSYKLSERIKFCLGEPNNNELLDEVAGDQAEELEKTDSNINVLDEDYGNYVEDDGEEKPVVFVKFFPDGTGSGKNAIISLNNFYYRLRVSAVTGYIYAEKIDDNGEIIKNR